jgi:hypothetical protein
VACVTVALVYIKGLVYAQRFLVHQSKLMACDLSLPSFFDFDVRGRRGCGMMRTGAADEGGDAPTGFAKLGTL